MQTEPTVEFFKIIDQARPPKRAERSAAGYLPSRAMRYCDALTTATGYGYWVFPPMDLLLMWDGSRVFWKTDEDKDWSDVTDTASGAVQFPGAADRFDEVAPPELQGCCPPFLTALPELGGIQIWSGLLVRTMPGWSLSVRAPVNLPPASPELIAWEGIIESDIWFGPLFNNFRIARTDVPVRLRATTPFLQVQPIQQSAYAERNLQNFRVSEPSALTTEDWGKVGTILGPHPAQEERQGLYAVTVRKRRACPVAH